MSRIEQAFDSLAGIVEMWGFGHHAEALATLRAELAGLRADAWRYRWLRDGLQANSSDAYEVTERAYMGNLDAAIDAARQQESSNGQ